MIAITQEILKKIRRIHFQTTRLAADLPAGSYRSVFKGRGIEFEEVREYQEGDEIRHIDWNVTARMNHPFVKVFREERELAMMLIVDVSASCRFGKKNEMMAEIGGVLAFSAIKNNDRIGLILFSDRVEKYIPPRKGTRHVLRLIRELFLFEPEGEGSDLACALTFFGHMQKQSGICFLISDFIHTSNLIHEVKLLAHRHDLIAIHTIDPREQKLPAAGLLEIEDLETHQKKIIDTSDPSVAEHQEQACLQRKTLLKEIANKTGMGLIEIDTDQPFMPRLIRFFRIRELQK